MTKQEFEKEFGVTADTIYVLFTPYTPFQRNTSKDDRSGSIVTYRRGFDTYLADHYVGHSMRNGYEWTPRHTTAEPDMFGIEKIPTPCSESELKLKASVANLTPLYLFRETLRDYRDDRYLMFPDRLTFDELKRLEPIIE